MVYSGTVVRESVQIAEVKENGEGCQFPVLLITIIMSLGHNCPASFTSSVGKQKNYITLCLTTVPEYTILNGVYR